MEGNITATVYSLVSSGDNSSVIVVTVVTNSNESPDTLTDLLTEPLEQRLQEFSNIDQDFMFEIVMTERHGMCIMPTIRTMHQKSCLLKQYVIMYVTICCTFLRT